MNEHLAADFATSLEGHYTTHQVGWLDYVLIIVSAIAVLISIWYTFRYLLPKGEQEVPRIMRQVLQDSAEAES